MDKISVPWSRWAGNVSVLSSFQVDLESKVEKPRGAEATDGQKHVFWFLQRFDYEASKLDEFGF